MSTLYNDYIIASNNSINENKYNAEKCAKSPSHRIKKILKPILKMLKQNKKKIIDIEFEYHGAPTPVNHSCCDESGWSSECDDNAANEELETRIFREIEQCNDDAAVYVYDDNECHLERINKYQQFVPVHFARTDAGTFFWTTVQKPVDFDLCQPTYCCSDFQQPELQFGDRWVQA